MNKILTAIIIFTLVVGGYFLFVREDALVVTNFEECVAAGYPVMESYPEQCRTPNGETFIREVEENIYESDRFGIRFSYPDGYELQEREQAPGQSAIIIMEEDVVIPENGEGPPTITIVIHDNASGQSLESWVRNDRDSNFQLSSGTFATGTVHGRTAIMYKSDGLYPTDNVVVSHKGGVIHLSGGYLTPEDEIRSDFQKVLSSIEFY